MNFAVLFALFFLVLSLFLTFLLVKNNKNLKKQNEKLKEQASLIADSTEDIKIASGYRSAFLANMSHEMRTPLNVIIGLTDLMLDDKNLNTKVLENLNKISNAGSTLLSIINDILDFSKIESGKLTLMPAEYHLSSVLNDIITLVNTNLSESSVSFVIDIHEDLPSMLYGDDLRVKQIVNNLLSNAIKFTSAGQIELSIKCEKDMSNNKEVWMNIVVSDTGMGISEESIAKIFTDYYGREGERGKNKEIRGLGLSITKRLAEMMEGSINVESKPGHGSVFTVRIKQGFVSDILIGSDVINNLLSFRYAEEKRELVKNLIRPDLSYARVLVVDDMQTNLDVALGLLGKYKLNIDSVLRGQDAIQKIQTGSPHYNAIFLDHMMPGMDGIETADAIRAINSDYARKIPIIALTANAVKGTEDLFYAHDFQAFLPKPIDIMRLDVIIRKWICNEKSEDNKSDLENNLSIPGINSKKGLSLYENNSQNYKLVLANYIKNTPLLLEKIRDVKKENLKDYILNMHGLKSISANIGADKTSESALTLEKYGKEENIEAILSKNDNFIVDTENLINRITKWLQEN